MSTDRGTVQRGLAPGQEQAGIRPEPTAPAGRRLPSAPRERKPALAALALLLIVGGALGAAYLVTQNAKRVAAIEISAQVGAGQKIPLSAMRQVQIASNSDVHFVPWSDASRVSQFYAASAIPPGTLLNGAMVIRASAVTKGKDVLGLSLKAGQLPDNLAIGDHVDVFDVNDSTTQCPGTSGGKLAADAVVLAVTPPSAASGSDQNDVIVALDPASAGAVACNASNGVVGLAVLPGGGTAATTPAPVPTPGVSTPVSGQTTPARPHRHRGGHASPSTSPSGGTG
jgi:hypothetical protein